MSSRPLTTALPEPWGEGPVPAALADVIGALATELEELALCGEGLQGMAARVAGSAASPGLVADLQAVDLLVQRLTALSTFARILAPAVPGEWRIDVGAATRSVTLAETRRRLEGRAAPAGAGDTGECDFF